MGPLRKAAPRQPGLRRPERRRPSGYLPRAGQPSRRALSQAVGFCLRGTLLREAILTGCRLEGTDLSQAHLRGADLSFCDLRQARLDDTRFGQNNLQQARVHWDRVGPARWLVTRHDGVAHGGLGELEQDFVYTVTDQKSGRTVAQFEASLYQCYFGGGGPEVHGPSTVEITPDARHIRLLENDRETLLSLPDR